MSDVAAKRQVEALAKRFQKKYGDKASSAGPRKKMDGYVLSTGIRSLDYALGNGIHSGSLVEIFGPPDIGKSSSLGLSLIRAAQAVGLLCAIINTEPGHVERKDDDAATRWLIDNGVDPEGVLMLYPDSGEDAFDILFECVAEKAVDLILFDSLGGITQAEEQAVGKTAKVAGSSKLISWGVTRIAQRAEKNNVTVVFINQIRDKVGDPTGGIKTPGGWAHEHFCQTRLQLRPGKTRHYVKGPAGDNVLYGRSIIVRVVRNKLNRGTNHRAEFTYYQASEEGHEVGVDQGEDIGRLAKALGVVRKENANSSWYVHPSFPAVGPKKVHKINGEENVYEYLSEHPEAAEAVWADVEVKMEEEKARLIEEEAKKALKTKKRGNKK